MSDSVSVADVRAEAEKELRHIERMIARNSENVGRWRLARELTLKGLLAFQLKTFDRRTYVETWMSDFTHDMQEHGKRIAMVKSAMTKAGLT